MIERDGLADSEANQARQKETQANSNPVGSLFLKKEGVRRKITHKAKSQTPNRIQNTKRKAHYESIPSRLPKRRRWGAEHMRLVLRGQDWRQTPQNAIPAPSSPRGRRTSRCLRTTSSRTLGDAKV